MRKQVLYCLIVALFFSTGMVNAASFKFDFNQDGIFENPQEVSILLSETVTVDVYLTDWTGDNIAGIDYYFLYDTSSMDAVSVSFDYLLKANGGPWDDQYYYIGYPTPGYIQLGVVEFGLGVAGPNVLLHRVVLQCTAPNTNPLIYATLGTDGIVVDKDGDESTDVSDAQGVIHQLECNTNSNCNDSSVCTVDSCNLGTHECVYTPLPDGTSCDDGLFCNGTDTCQAGGCVTGAPPCPEDANPCNDCNEETDICCSATGFSDPCCVDPACEDEDVCLFEIIDYYVDGENGNNGNDGMTAATAWKTITYALSQVTADENTLATIHVAPATYDTDMGGDSETFPLIMKEYVSLQGSGYAETTIDANQSGSVILFEQEADPIQNVTIDGFTITGGRNYMGGGLTILSADPTISNCLITGNTAYERFGGGIYMEYADVTVSNCIISNNSAPHMRGGGISCHYFSNASIINCTVVKNFAGSGTNQGGGGIATGYTSTATITNCILRSNEGDDPNIPGDSSEIYAINPSGVTVNYSCIEGGWSGSGSNNSDADPRFRSSDDYHLIYGSPAIDSGSSDDALTSDIDGNPRYDHSATPNTGSGGSPYYDMGAYEYQGDSDGDGVLDDGDGSGAVDDNPCTVLVTADCDDNCIYTPNSAQKDTGDWDGVGDVCDNCATMPNGPIWGTCVKEVGGLIASYRIGASKSFILCSSNAECTATGGTCQLEQGDCNNNSLGDVCECYANFTYPDDQKVNAADLGVYIIEYGRIDCSDMDPCNADGNDDGKVSLSDLALYKNEYARFGCPALP